VELRILLPVRWSKAGLLLGQTAAGVLCARTVRSPCQRLVIACSSQMCTFGQAVEGCGC
jgi:hypothetical protein